MTSKRCNMRKAFLAPWHPDVKRIWLYALAYCQQKYDVAIHTASLPVNHEHLLLTPSEANLPKFVQDVHADVSRGVNALLTQEKYDAPRELWDSREPHYLRLMDAPAQAASSQYVHLNCVAAGLVSRPSDMPGFNFDFEPWKSRYVEVRRPQGFFSEERPEVLTLEVTPPPLLYEAFNGNFDALVAYMKELERESIRVLRAKQKRGPLGAQRLTRLHPWSEPRTLRETGGQRVPCFRYGARDILGQRLEVEGAREVHHFRRDNREARLARRDGEPTRAFPLAPTRSASSTAPRSSPLPSPARRPSPCPVPRSPTSRPSSGRPVRRTPTSRQRSKRR